MRQVRVPRLHRACSESGHRIAAAVGTSRYTVAECLRRAAVVSVTWPAQPEFDDAALKRKLFTSPRAIRPETVVAAAGLGAHPRRVQAPHCSCSGEHTAAGRPVTVFYQPPT
jgi:hypothetical protein